LKPMKALGCEFYVLPLLGESLANAENWESFLTAIDTIVLQAADQGIRVVLESLLDAHSLLALLKKLNRNSLGVCFDTGNRCATCEPLMSDTVPLFASVHHLHITTKDAAEINIMIATGHANFSEIFSAFKNITY